MNPRAQFASGVVDATDWTREKLAWHLRIMCDPVLKDRAKILASLLLHDFNIRTGDAWRSQVGDDSLSARAGWKGARVVQHALAELVEAGYLERDVLRGRGRSNRYRPVFGKVNLHSGYRQENPNPRSPLADEKANAGSAFADENANLGSPIEDEKANAGAAKGERTFVLTLVDTKTPPFPPVGALGHSQEGLAGQARTACAVPSEIRSALVAECGEAVVRSWLDPCSWDGETQEVVPHHWTRRARIVEKIGDALARIGASVAVERR